MFRVILTYLLLYPVLAANKVVFNHDKNNGKFNAPHLSQISRRLNVVHQKDITRPVLVQAVTTQEDIGPTVIPTVAPTTSVTPPPNCINNDTDIMYVNGFISATQTIANCLNNIADPYNIPTYYSGTFNGAQTVYTNIQVNNLHNVDALAGSVTLDFYLRLYWKDDRFNMPSFWEKMSKTTRSQGVELTRLMESGNIPFWLPDIRFHDAESINAIVETVRINASNIIFWSQHILLTIIQPKLDFTEYPSDEQIIQLRYGSFAYNQNFFQLKYLEPALSFNQNYDGSFTFFANPIWSYSPTDTSANYYLSSSGFVNAIFHIAVSRQGQGVIVRLIMPIALLLYLAGITFWAEYTQRVDTTSNLLFAVSAMYVVILDNIPMVGYLTKVDTFVFWMYLLLIFIIIIHQTYESIRTKMDRFPLRRLVLRLIETLGRLSIFPIVTAFYMTSVNEIEQNFNIVMILIVALVGFVTLINEMKGMISTWDESILALVLKLDGEDIMLDDITVAEIVVFNYWRYQIVSISNMHVARMIAEHGHVSGPGGGANDRIKVKNLQILSELTKPSILSTYHAKMSKYHKIVLQSQHTTSYSTLNTSTSITTTSAATTAAVVAEEGNNKQNMQNSSSLLRAASANNKTPLGYTAIPTDVLPSLAATTAIIEESVPITTNKGDSDDDDKDDIIVQNDQYRDEFESHFDIDDEACEEEDDEDEDFESDDLAEL